MRDLRNRLQDILEAIAQIEVEQRKGKAAFDASSLIQVWMVHHLMMIGEAVRSIDPAIRQRYPSVPWRQITGMRNILVHDYFRINKAVVSGGGSGGRHPKGCGGCFWLLKECPPGPLYRRMTPESAAPQSEQVAAFFKKHCTGLVTLVFTDLVDSVALLSRLGDQAGATFMQRRRQIVREVLQGLPEGEEIETAGDSFLLAFAKPSDAVRFALQSQARLRRFSAESNVPVLRFERAMSRLGNRGSIKGLWAKGSEVRPSHARPSTATNSPRTLSEPSSAPVRMIGGKSGFSG